MTEQLAQQGGEIQRLTEEIATRKATHDQLQQQVLLNVSKFDQNSSCYLVLLCIVGFSIIPFLLRFASVTPYSG